MKSSAKIVLGVVITATILTGCGKKKTSGTGLPWDEPASTSEPTEIVYVLPTETPTPTTEPYERSDTPNMYSDNAALNSLDPYKTGKLAKYKNLEMIPVFDTIFFTSEFILTEDSEAGSVLVTDTATGTKLWLYDSTGEGTMEAIAGGVYGYRISSYAGDERFSFQGLLFGASEAEVLETYKDLSPIYHDDSTDETWSHRWQLSAYYTFTLTGTADGGLQYVELRNVI